MRVEHLQTPKANGRNARLSASRPHPDFPLFKHDSGRWAKKIRTKFHYFGSVAADPTGEAALNLWLEQKDDLLAGRRPRVRRDAFTVEDLCNHFLEHKEQLKESGELEPRTFNRYFKSCEFLLDHFGKRRVVDDLRPLDFQELRSVMAQRWGPVALGNEIQMVRSAFKFAYEAELIEKPVRFGPGFKKPSAKTLRLERAKGGERMFTPAEIKLLLKYASVNFKAMILLGINSGMGNTDLGLLPTSAVDPESVWLNYPRTKNGIPRRIPLWPETQKALAKVIAERRQPKDELRRRWKPHKLELLERDPNSQLLVRFHRACSWLQCVETLEDPACHDLALISRWIAFNALYGQWDALKREPLPDRECWRVFIGHVLEIDVDSRIADVLLEHKRLVIALLDDPYLSSFFWQEPCKQRAGKAKRDRFQCVLSVSVPDAGGAFASVAVFHSSREDSPCGLANVQKCRHPFHV